MDALQLLTWSLIPLSFTPLTLPPRGPMLDSAVAGALIKQQIQENNGNKTTSRHR